MNYLLKLQPSPGGIVEYLLSNSKHSSTMYCFCGNCLKHHPVFRSKVQQCRNSTHVSTLKLQLHKRRISKRNEGLSKRIEATNHAKKLTEMLKIMPPKYSPKNFLINRNKLSEFSGWKSRYNIDCTKSYDPNMLNCNLEVQIFNRPLEHENTLQQIIDSDSKNTTDLKYSGFGRVSVSHLNSDLKEKRSPFRLMSMPQKPLKNFIIEELVTVNEPMSEIVNEESVEKPVSSDVQQKTISELIDFEKFTLSLNHDYSSLQFLHSSIDICITNGMTTEAYSLFQNYRAKVVWQRVVAKKYKIIQDICNSLLYTLSSKGYWYLMKKVTNWMATDNIKLNCESFAALLHCLAKVRESRNEEFVLQELSKILNSIFTNNIALNDIFCKTKLPKEALEIILATVREVVPSFEIKPDIMELSSDCPLVKNLHGGPSSLQPQLDGVKAEDMERLVEEQLLMEKNFYLDVKAVSRGLPGEAPPDLKEKIETLKGQWRTQLTKAVSSLRKAQKLEFSKSRELFNLHLYTSCLPVSTIVDILMEFTQNMVEFSGGFSPSCDQFYRKLGVQIFQRYQLRKKDVWGFTDKTEKIFRKYVYWYANPSGPAMNSRQKWQMLIQDSEKTLDPHVIKWPEEVFNKVGKYFVDIILKEVKFTVLSNEDVVTLPVLYTVLRYRQNSYREEIKCHPTVAELFDSVGFDSLHFRTDEVPMVCPPKPWKSPEHGGYLFLPTDFIRRPGGVQGKTISLKDLPVQQLYATFDSLNSLQSIPWMINEGVLEVALEVFKSGGSEKLGVPLLPEKLPPREKLTAGLSYEERKDLHSKRLQLIKNLGNNYSLWCETLYRLSLANHYRKKVFWMPQNCDFRGRVYPVPPLINHLGSDLFRSLLVFAKGKPLGPKGLDWLKIHLINLTGTHKRKSIKARLEYANEILPFIIDSAENPLMGNKWWAESEEPWQTLASCMELKKALSNPNPETYICQFPIHQDGSCNGLQHYAALGKDLTGAHSVNLTPCDKPQDVYTVVAALIEEERAKDALSGIEVAKILKGFVERKVVKQTVMTTVYGVTPYGAKLQITRRLEGIPNFPPEYVSAAAIYLTHKTFACLKKMFTSAKQIQEWFIDCADEICDKKDYVQWISPLGLPIVQSYAKYRTNGDPKRRILYVFGKKQHQLGCDTAIVLLSDINFHRLPDRMKQRNAFPPNFIHSLDSSHMMLTSLYCEQAGVTFSAVHDCFWTHPNSVDQMNRICREQFISLHSQPILENLSQFFKKTYTNGANEESIKIFESLPEKGSFDINEVFKSVYFFS